MLTSIDDEWFYQTANRSEGIRQRLQSIFGDRRDFRPPTWGGVGYYPPPTFGPGASIPVIHTPPPPPVIPPPPVTPVIPVGGGETVPAPTSVPAQVIQPKGDDMSLDLGKLIGDLGSTYIDAKYGQPSVGPFNPYTYPPIHGQQVGWNDPYSGPGSWLVNPPVQQGPPAIMAQGCQPPRNDSDGKSDYWFDPNANCGQGKWKKKRRRRRNRLATKGDLHDLAALKGILGNGAAFKVWIATH